MCTLKSQRSSVLITLWHLVQPRQKRDNEQTIHEAILRLPTPRRYRLLAYETQREYIHHQEATPVLTTHPPASSFSRSRYQTNQPTNQTNPKDLMSIIHSTPANKLRWIGEQGLAWQMAMRFGCQTWTLPLALPNSSPFTAPTFRRFAADRRISWACANSFGSPGPKRRTRRRRAHHPQCGRP
ncbi:MAG: hypothetical protein IPM39_29320 [Chloroflexi bacterium]|nr:hypothetical protein [Chloroflexota bacterium]